MNDTNNHIQGKILPDNVAGEINSGAKLHAGYQGILDLIKQKEANSNRLRYMADALNSSMANDSDDELEGRSVFQEVDYKDKKKAQKQIKETNYRN